MRTRVENGVSYLYRKTRVASTERVCFLSVKSPEMAKQVYTVSLLAIEVDTEAERTHINTLAQQLDLDESGIDDIHRKLGIEKP